MCASVGVSVVLSVTLPPTPPTRPPHSPARPGRQRLRNFCVPRHQGPHGDGPRRHHPPAQRALPLAQVGWEGWQGAAGGMPRAQPPSDVPDGGASVKREPQCTAGTKHYTALQSGLLYILNVNARVAARALRSARRRRRRGCAARGAAGCGQVPIDPSINPRAFCAIATPQPALDFASRPCATCARPAEAAMAGVARSRLSEERRAWRKVSTGRARLADGLCHGQAPRASSSSS